MQTPCQQSTSAVPQYLAPHGGVTPAHHHLAGDIHPHFMYNVLYIGEQRSTP